MANDKDTQTATKDAAARGRSAADEAAKQADSTTRRAADAARDIGEDNARTAEATSRRAADTAREATDAGADIARRGAETMRDTSRDMTALATRSVDEATERFQRLFGLSGHAPEQVAHQANRNMEVMTQCGGVLMDGMQSIWREWMTLAQDATQRQLDGMNTMLRSRSVQDLFAAQSDLMKDELELFLNRSVRISELAAKTANDAAQRLNNRAEEQSRHMRRRA